MRLLCTELGRAEERANSMIRISASSRLAEVLLMIDSAYGTGRDGTLGVVLRPSEYADLTNIARGSVYRLLNNFAELGIISFSGMTIRILDRSKLRSIAGL